MSAEDRESFYYNLLETSRIAPETLSELFEENFVNDKPKVNWIFQKAIIHRDTKIIDFLLASGIKINVLNKLNQTAVHLAVYHDFFDIVNSLFSHCDDDTNHTDHNGLSHFHIACIVGNADLVLRFLQNGVDVNLSCHYEANTFTSLHLAVKFVRARVVEVLLNHGADPNAVDRFRTTSLHLACRSSSARIIEKIGNQEILIFGRGILETLVERNDEIAVVRLLVRYRSDVNARDQFGNTPLFFIFLDNCPERIGSLTHPYSCNFRMKRMILQELRQRQRAKVEFLLENNAGVRMYNDAQETILHLVIDGMKISRRPRCLPNVYFDDIDNAELVGLFLRRGADVDAKNGRGESPLQLAVSLLSFDVVKVLLKYNADFKFVRFDYVHDDCFLYYADVIPCLEATENLIKIVDELVSRGLHLSENDKLATLEFLVRNHVNCRYGYPKDKYASCKLLNLLELGATTTIKNALNQFPENIDDSSYMEQSLRKTSARQIHRHVVILETGGLYIPQELKDCLRSKAASLEKCLLRCFYSDGTPIASDLNGIKEEVQRMKMTMLNKYTSLHDLLTMDHRKTYSRMKHCDYGPIVRSEEFSSDFPACGGIIKGHFAKTLVRRYVVRSATDCLRSLVNVTLPELCCEKVCDFLSNESLLDLCLAATKKVETKDLGR